MQCRTAIIEAGRGLARAARQVVSRRWALLVLVAIISAWGSRNTVGVGLALDQNRAAEEWHRDYDLMLIHDGLEDVPRLGDTWRWWTGTWVGQVPFWRPLTSYAFWLQWRLFGWEHRAYWHYTQAGLHVAACICLFLVLESVTGGPWAGLVMLLVANIGQVWFGSQLYLPRGAVPCNLVVHWKDQPDQWMAVCLFLSALCALRGRLILAAALAVLAAGFKETGFTAFPLVVAFYWFRFRRFPRVLAVTVLVGAATACVRWRAVGFGYAMGSNVHWAYRMATFAAAGPVADLSTPLGSWSIVGVFAAIAVVLRRIRWAAYGAVVTGLLAGWVISLLWFAQTDGAGWDVALFRQMDVRPLATVGGCAFLWTLLAYAGLRGRCRGGVVLLAGAALLTGLPATMAPQVQPHAYYVSRLFVWSLFAVCLLSLGDALRPSPTASPHTRREP